MAQNITAMLPSSLRVRIGGSNIVHEYMVADPDPQHDGNSEGCVSQGHYLPGAQGLGSTVIAVGNFVKYQWTTASQRGSEMKHYV